MWVEFVVGSPPLLLLKSLFIVYFGDCSFSLLIIIFVNKKKMLETVLKAMHML